MLLGRGHGRPRRGRYAWVWHSRSRARSLSVLRGLGCDRRGPERSGPAGSLPSGMDVRQVLALDADAWPSGFGVAGRAWHGLRPGRPAFLRGAGVLLRPVARLKDHALTVRAFRAMSAGGPYGDPRLRDGVNDARGLAYGSHRHQDHQCGEEERRWVWWVVARVICCGDG